MLAQPLRENERVVVRERTNALHLQLPEPMDLVVIDVGWTPQRRIIPAALRLLGPDGQIVSLLKPHYEAARGATRDGVLSPEQAEVVAGDICLRLQVLGYPVAERFLCPRPGAAGNREYFIRLRARG
jgi:23S rRNA (cytidine1920-2'-O)/16S rRNA (cytidine1409-2'-O)-methyltransferase